MSKKTNQKPAARVRLHAVVRSRKLEQPVERTKDAVRSGVGRREQFFVEKLGDYFNAVRELYERVCGKSYPDHNYAADDFLLLKLVGDRAELLRVKLDEWVQPCFCRGKAKCLMCETRILLAGGAERRANKRARRTKNGAQAPNGAHERDDEAKPSKQPN